MIEQSFQWLPELIASSDPSDRVFWQPILIGLVMISQALKAAKEWHMPMFPLNIHSAVVVIGAILILLGLARLVI